MVACPKCGEELDVYCYNPLDRIQCGACGENFDLLRDFGDYRLQMSYNAGWQNAIYIGEHRITNKLAIIKVLSSHVLGQPKAVEEFFKEAEQISSMAGIRLVDDYHTGIVCGFHYISIGLTIGTTQEAARETAGMLLSPDVSETQSIRFDLQQESTDEVKSRQIECPYCDGSVDVTKHDPLDRVVCNHCQESFELLRQFGDFRIDSRLNEGGSSVLYIAYSRKFRKDTALKVLSAAEMQGSPESLKRFLQESELTRKLEHPNIIHIYDSGEFKGFYFMSMELVSGMTLDDMMYYIQRRSVEFEVGESWETENKKKRNLPSLPELICLEIMLQAATGLGVAHKNGLVHGDIKPANIMVTYEGIVKVLDFGLAQFSNTEKLIKENEQYSIQGTPLYIPPERVRGEPEDFRSDIYGLGATLYHLLRGIAPFRARTASEVAMMHAQSPLLVFRAHAPWVSESTAHIVERSMKKRVSDRYTSHLEFIADLTLAKNQILNTLPNRSRDGRSILKNFMKSFPSEKEGMPLWKNTQTTAIRTYRPKSAGNVGEN